MGINGSTGIYGRMAGTSRSASATGTRRASYKQQQQAQNKANAGKVVLTLAAIAAAIKFRKPIGKFLQPVTNAISTKFPTLANAGRAVKGRAGRIFTPIKNKVSNWFTKSATPAVKKAAQDTVEFTRDKAAPAVKKAAQDTVTFTKDTAAPAVKKGIKGFLEKIAQKANSDLPRLN